MRDVLSLPCVTQKMAARDPEGEGFFCIMHDELNERETTCSLVQGQSSACWVYFYPYNLHLPTKDPYNHNLDVKRFILS